MLVSSSVHLREEVLDIFINLYKKRNWNLKMCVYICVVAAFTNLQFLNKENLKNLSKMFLKIILENERWSFPVSERQQMVSGRCLKWRHPHSDSEKLSERLFSASSSVIIMTLLTVSWVCDKQAVTGAPSAGFK